jgi:hypothetical protein
MVSTTRRSGLSAWGSRRGIGIAFGEELAEPCPTTSFTPASVVFRGGGYFH